MLCGQAREIKVWTYFALRRGKPAIIWTSAPTTCSHQSLSSVKLAEFLSCLISQGMYSTLGIVSINHSYCYRYFGSMRAISMMAEEEQVCDDNVVEDLLYTVPRGY